MNKITVESIVDGLSDLGDRAWLSSQLTALLDAMIEKIESKVIGTNEVGPTFHRNVGLNDAADIIQSFKK